MKTLFVKRIGNYWHVSKNNGETFERTHLHKMSPFKNVKPKIQDMNPGCGVLEVR